MANARSRKREIDKAKRERAAGKRERRQERVTDTDQPEGTTTTVVAQANEGGVLDALQALHKRYDDEQISFEEFEEARAELLSRLTVD